MKTESIPNKGKFKLEFINNVPVIYVSNILDDSNTLKFALDSLCSIQSRLKYYDQIDDSNNEHIQNDMVDFTQKLYNRLSNMISNMNVMKSSIDALDISINDISSSITYLQNNHDIFKKVDNESSSKLSNKVNLKENILKDMRLFQEKNSRIPCLSDMLTKYKSSIFRGDLSFKNLKKQI